MFSQYKKICTGLQWRRRTRAYIFEVKKIPDNRIQEITDLPSVKAAWGEVLGFAQFIKILDGETVLISNGFAPTFGAAWDTNPTHSSGH